MKSKPAQTPATIGASEIKLNGVADIYNPAASKDGPAAKLWELLRRNPAFREDVAWILANLNRKEAKQRTIKYMLSALRDEKCISRPFAGYVLRWLRPPVFAEPTKIIHSLFGSKATMNDLGRKIFGPTMCDLDDTWHDYKDMGPDEFMKLCPLYLLHTHKLLGQGRGPELSVRLLLPNTLRANGSLPQLRLSEGEFHLGTPWNETPELFQKQFRWLWANYDAKALNPYANGRILLPRPGVKFGNCTYARQEQISKMYLKVPEEFIFVVPMCFHTENSIKGVTNAFKSALLEKFRPVQISAKKYESLFGGKSEFEVFTFVRDHLKYSADVPRKPLSLDKINYSPTPGRGNIYARYEEAKRNLGIWGANSNFSSHTEKRYGEMEALMFVLYPGCEFRQMIPKLYPGWRKRLHL